MTHITDRFRPAIYTCTYFIDITGLINAQKNRSAFIMSQCRRMEVPKLCPIFYQVSLTERLAGSPLYD